MIKYMQHKWNATKYNSISSPQYISGLKLINHIKPINISSIIDIGCGTGTLTYKLSKLLPEANILGIDISASMIKKAIKNIKSTNIKFICNNFLDLNITNKVDLIFSNKVLHWILDHDMLFNKIYNSLNISGQFVASFGVEGSMPQFRKICNQIELDFNLLNLKLANYNDTIKLLTKIGFKVNYREIIWDKCNMHNKKAYQDFVENVLLQGSVMSSIERSYLASKISKYAQDYAFNFADLSIVAIK